MLAKRNLLTTGGEKIKALFLRGKWGGKGKYQREKKKSGRPRLNDLTSRMGGGGKATARGPL